ncbi:hypothetical protein NC651_000896 [Populus alba x Populus x berolinensis]|nr:hypothetical protein NC651_000896 [Populus alba x Populus x berolinensis]
MGEAAYLSKHKVDLQRSFYRAIPGLAVIIVMFVTTCLMVLVVVMLWKPLLLVAKGGWLPLIFSLIVLSVMYIWHHVTLQKQSFESHNRTSLDMLLSLGTNIGINRVRGVGLVYTNVLSEIPPMFSHFVTNVPAFHHVLIIVTFQYLTIPRVFCQSAIYCKPDYPPPLSSVSTCALCQESNMYWMLENGSGAGSEIRRKRVRFCGVGSVKGIGGTGGCQGSCQNATLIRQPSRHGVSGKDFGVVRGSNQRKWEGSNQMQQKNCGYPL